MGWSDGVVEQSVHLRSVIQQFSAFPPEADQPVAGSFLGALSPSGFPSAFRLHPLQFLNTPILQHSTSRLPPSALSLPPSALAVSHHSISPVHFLAAARNLLLLTSASTERSMYLIHAI